MMKLTLSVPLIWMLFSTAEALKCVQGFHSLNDERDKIPQPCASPDDQCLTVSMQHFRNNTLEDTFTKRSCAPPSLCSEVNQPFSFSYSDSGLSASLQCCSTDGCNSKDIPYPDEQKPNNLTCNTCDELGQSCNQTLQCVGIQDRCISVNPEALKCVKGLHKSNEGSSSDPRPCASPDDQCVTLSMQAFKNNTLKVNFTKRICAPSSVCSEANELFSSSYNDFRWTGSLQCCSTDGCNSTDIPFFDEQKPNSLTCFSCDVYSQSCNQTQQCVGIQDRCIFVNGAAGCASANLCEDDSETKWSTFLDADVHDDQFRFSAPKCCGTSLCNSAPTA